MTDLNELLGIDPNDPVMHLAGELVRDMHETIHALVNLREQRGLSRSDVAESLSWPVAKVSNFERVGGDPYMSEVRRYALAIGARISTTVQAVD